MKIFIAIFGIIMLLYVAIFMGMILRWNDEKGDAKVRWGKAWHGWSSILRFGVIILWIPYFWIEIYSATLLFLIFSNLSWAFYDGICNWFRNLSFWYIGSASSGTGSWWDKIWTQKSSKIVKIILMTSTIIYAIIYIVLL